MSMIFWTKAILACQGLLVSAADLIDARIEDYSGFNSFYMGTDRQIDEICKLYEKKGKLINLRVLGNMIRKSIPKQHFVVLAHRYIEGDSINSIADDFGITRNTVLYRLRKSLKACIAFLTQNGYNEDFFDSFFKDEREWLTLQLDKIDALML